MKIKTIRFGKKYAKGRPEYTKGKFVSMKGKKAMVLYEGGDETYTTEIGHLMKDEDDNRASSDNVVATVCYKGKWYKKSQTFYSIMATLEVGCALKDRKKRRKLTGLKTFLRPWLEMTGGIGLWQCKRRMRVGGPLMRRRRFDTSTWREEPRSFP